jgi:hypothetical protein
MQAEPLEHCGLTVMKVSAGSLAMALLGAPAALAAPAFTCGGFAILGGAQLLCSQTDPVAPAQICNFSWTLMSASTGQTVVSGSFLLMPGLTNAIVYQGTGYSYALSNPVVLCQTRQPAAAGDD